MKSEAKSPVSFPNQADLPCIQSIRGLAIDAIQKANSGHPGLPLGATPMAYLLWRYHLRHNPSNPSWMNRDRFVLSAGHGSMLLYSLLHHFKYALTLDEIKNFRQWGSKTPGHPEAGLTAGVEATTGPLGQGAANAVGMAMAERSLAFRFNRPGYPIVDHWTYALVSDGDLMEGVSAEACSLAGHMGLGKLIFLYDANDITLDGPTSLAFSKEDVAGRFRAYGWQVLMVEDGDEDFSALNRALQEAKANGQQPTLIVVKTTIGYGSPNKAGTSSSHGSPLGESEVKLTKQALGLDDAREFFVPSSVQSEFTILLRQLEEFEKEWNVLWSRYQADYPELTKDLETCFKGGLPQSFELPHFGLKDAMATRQASGKVIQAIAKQVPYLLGGDADLSCSTNTLIQGGNDFDGRTGSGRNVHYGVREHGMAAIANGICYHGGVRPFVSTFLCFSDYMKPSIRLAAMNHLPVICVFTHDSIGLGEDGPTHQPVEQVMALRGIPNSTVIRPADANETAAAWEMAIRNKNGPTALILSRQKLPNLPLDTDTVFQGTVRGAYVVRENKALDAVVLIATGSEVSPALDAAELLLAKNIPCRVVSMPCWELFEKQDVSYRESVLPRSAKFRVSIEAGITLGWQKWVGHEGLCIGVDRYGASAPAEQLFDFFGLTAEKIAAAVYSLVTRQKNSN